MRRVTCWPSLFRPAEGRCFSARALVERVKAPRAYARREDVPRWSGAEFRDGYRSLACFLRASWLVLDFDRGTARERISATFAELAGFAHTTWSSTPAVRRWRVALTLSRSVDREEHDRVWRAGAAIAELAGLEPDYAARDASRAWALPARHAGDSYEHLELAGAPFDVESALARFPAPAPDAEPARFDRTDSYDHRLDRARRYLEKMPGAISGSGGHATTFRAAVAMVRGFALDPDEALRLLVEVHNPLCAPPWSEPELRHKVKSAVTRARLEHGWLADRPLRRTA
jgi:hypothetical protein